MRVVPFVFQLASPVNVDTSGEVAEAFWVPLTTLEALQVVTRQVTVQEGVLAVDSFNFEGRVIWGLTFRIINLLLNRASPGSS
jgi:hypothetical protein